MLIKYFILIIFLLISVAFTTLIERQLMGFTQRRKGPNIIGFFGLLQAIADGLKLFLKEHIIPKTSNKILFFLIPGYTFFLSLVNWSIFPFTSIIFLLNNNYSFLIFIMLSTFNIYSTIFAGWSSNSKYALLGGIRSTAQMISYEIILSFLNLFFLFWVKSFNLNDFFFIQNKFILFNFNFIFIFFYFILLLAETNRHPFDLPEAESELVAGFNVEYSSFNFALFFLAEYLNIIFVCSILTIFTIGSLKINYLIILLFISLFILIRAILPRYRYDQLIFLCWKQFLPLILFFFIFFILILFFYFPAYFTLSTFKL